MTLDEAIKRYIDAFDEIEFIAGRIQEMCLRAKNDEEFNIARDYLEAMVEKAETLRDDLEATAEYVKER